MERSGTEGSPVAIKILFKGLGSGCRRFLGSARNDRPDGARIRSIANGKHICPRGILSGTQWSRRISCY
ncbi:hypothetical protein [Ravibacter arvi]|uniref:hypothetical protein n=1 Tax=Ravibacter arvi TaxID=2051041 RepID=UPI0031EA5906